MLFGSSFTGGALPLLLRLILFLSCFSATLAQISRPVDKEASPSYGSPRFIFDTRQIPIKKFYVQAFERTGARLSEESLRRFNATGILVKVGPDNVNKINQTNIAFISCDDSAYSGNLKVDETIKSALSSNNPPVSILLYTTELQTCTYTPGRDLRTTTSVFSLKDPDTAKKISNSIDDSLTGNTSSIIADGINPMKEADSGGDNTRNSAMIVLYAVTGIITALFLGVIITGAVRAHLHPERYGPRNVPGHPRQSRAKGIARAMLETIPIVKFGDNDDKNHPQKPDIEMRSSDGDHEYVRHDTDNADNTETRPEKSPADEGAAETHSPRDDAQNNQEKSETLSMGENPPRPSDEGSTQIGPAKAAASKTKDATRQEPPNSAGILGCPICTDDFVKGQDVRLLPCNHKFHPECVDPWLVNVSGTCPLCRIDLHPVQEENEDRDPASDVENDPPFDPLGIRPTIIEERLHEVRRLRSSQQALMRVLSATEGGRRNRLSQMFIDNFRIRTNRHGEDPSP